MFATRDQFFWLALLPFFAVIYTTEMQDHRPLKYLTNNSLQSQQWKESRFQLSGQDCLSLKLRIMNNVLYCIILLGLAFRNE